MHERGDLAELGQRLFDVRSAPTAQVTPERIADVVARAAVDERPCDVRPSQRTPVASEELCLDVLELDRHAEALELGDDLLAAAAARCPRVAQESLQPFVLVRQKQGEHMQLAPRRPHAELTSGNDTDPELRAFVRRLRHAVRGVVIGERDHREIYRTGAARDLLRLTLAVGSRRMAMQVNVRRNRPQGQSTPAATGGTARAARARRARRRRARASGSRAATSA